MEAQVTTFPEILQQQSAYQTAMIGKWHLKSAPTGFDYWEVLSGQGEYYNPAFRTPEGTKQYDGYVSDIVTDRAIEWLEDGRAEGEPFLLMYQHKAPHRNWQPGPEHLTTYDDVEVQGRDLTRWKYQRYMKDYLRSIRSMDDAVGRLLGYLDESGLSENTLVVYSSDQGFLLGEKGWFDKRWMYEESLKMPLIVRWPGVAAPGSENEELVQNLDFAKTFLEVAGARAPAQIQGRSLAPLLRGEPPDDWRDAVYYHYYEFPRPHHVHPHDGVRTERYKLIHYYTLGQWELFDLERDPGELESVYDDPDYAEVQERLKRRLKELRRQYDVPELGDEAAGATGGRRVPREGDTVPSKRLLPGTASRTCM